MQTLWPTVVVLMHLMGGMDGAPAPDAAPPNIVLILADDLGYADVSCYGGRIPTPQVDRLAQAGLRFTDAHSSSSVCSPTRYGLLTGRYNWRSKLQQFVLGGLSPRLIEPGRLTLGALLQEHGYHTACIGKWHLGMDWFVRPGGTVSELSIETREQVWNVDYAQPIANGPNSVGFDEYFGISGSLDMVPYTFIENDRVTVLPTEDRDFLLMAGREQGGRARRGPAARGFDPTEVLPTLVRRAVEYIAGRAASAQAGSPFFLYLPLSAPHTPIYPAAAWQTASGMNPYADFVMQMDGAIGEVLAALDAHDLAASTLVIVTSDNGCSPEAQLDELAAHGHRPGGPLRGGKADLFEGGHRVPFLVRWPGHVPAGQTTAQLICLTDVLATLAELLGTALPPQAGEDSISFLPVLQGKPGSPRHQLVSHSINGSFAVREGSWKLLLCPDSGGWSAPRPGSPEAAQLPPCQLYDLATDLGEQHNVYDREPARVEHLTALLEQWVADGRSTPGPPQANYGPVRIRPGER